jgi:hypothetical protein
MLAVIALAMLGTAQQAQAAPIIYTLTGEASGTIGNTSFTNADIVLTATADTNNTEILTDPEIPFEAFATPFNTFTINIEGVGTATVLVPSEILSVPQPLPDLGDVPVVVFGRTDSPPDLTGLTGIGFIGSVDFTGYNTMTAFGPLTAMGGIGFPTCGVPGHDPCIQTSLGFLSFTENPEFPITTQTTFTATLQTQAVPEPATLFLVGTGAAAVIRKSRARRRYLPS